MILDVSYRTDIPAFYSEWFINRLKEGFLYQRNPSFQSKVTKINLDPSTIDIMTFCSKDYSNVLKNWEAWDSLTNKQFRTYYYYTITPYDNDVENVPKWEYQFENLKKLTSYLGKEKIGWRYDPILITEKYTFDWHVEMFEKNVKRNFWLLFKMHHFICATIW